MQLEVRLSIRQLCQGSPSSERPSASISATVMWREASGMGNPADKVYWLYIGGVLCSWPLRELKIPATIFSYFTSSCRRLCQAGYRLWHPLLPSWVTVPRELLLHRINRPPYATQNNTIHSVICTVKLFKETFFFQREKVKKGFWSYSLNGFWLKNLTGARCRAPAALCLPPPRHRRR